MSRDGLSLAELIDLEQQLEADRAVDLETLRARDRAIGLNTAVPSESRAGQLRAWLASLRAREPVTEGGTRRLGPTGEAVEAPHPREEHQRLGASIMRGARLLAAALALVGLSIGAGAARVLLQFDGVRPVNVLPMLGVLVLLQIALLTLVLGSVALAAAVPGLAQRLPLLGDVRAALRGLATWLASRSQRAQGAPARWTALLHRLRARSRLHARIEMWWMTLIAQSFGIAFNVGALAMLIVLPSLLKYSFCWSTTLSLGPPALHQLTSILAWPWSAVLPAAVPSPALIEATQFDLLTREYAGGARPASGAWWPFLLAAATLYGLLPRVLLAITAALQLRSALAALPLDTPDVEALLRRLRLPLVETRGQAPSEQPRRPAAVHVAPSSQGADRACGVVAWRDLPVDRNRLAHWLQAQLGWSPVHYYSAGGADVDADRASIAAAAATGMPVVVLAESWEPPDKALRRFLKALREAAGASTKLAVVLVHGAEPGASGATDLQVWSNQLAALEDPYLSVESMQAS